MWDQLEDLDISEGKWEIFEMVKELNLDVSAQELLSAERGFTYADLYAMLGDEDTVAWLTPDVNIMRANGGAEALSYKLVEDGYCEYRFIADGKEILATAQLPRGDGDC
jgi:hypothetical protein